MSTPTEVAALVSATNNLTQTVIDKRTEITQTVATKITELDNWKSNLKPTDIQAEPRYESTIDLTGLSTDRYYPVWWGTPNYSFGIKTIIISRSRYNNLDIAPLGDGVTTLPGLLLELEAAGYQYGDVPFLEVKRLRQHYGYCIRKICMRMQCSSVLPNQGQLDATYPNVISKKSPRKSGLYLRGGFSYKVFSNGLLGFNYSRLNSEVLIDPVEGKGLFMARSYHATDAFLGDEYDNFTAAYNAFPDDIS